MRRWCAVQKTFCLSEMKGRERREVKVMAALNRTEEGGYRAVITVMLIKM